MFVADVVISGSGWCVVVVVALLLVVVAMNGRLRCCSYTPDANRTTAYYVKSVKMPGAELLELPTVVVDAAVDVLPTRYGSVILCVIA